MKRTILQNGDYTNEEHPQVSMYFVLTHNLEVSGSFYLDNDDDLIFQVRYLDDDINAVDLAIDKYAYDNELSIN